MKLTLQREGKIKVLDAISTITVYQDDRPDIYNLLRFIEENGTNYSLLRERIGGNYSDFVIRGIVRFLEDNQLIDKENNITSKGRRFLETKKFPSEERGQFRFWIIEDPLVNKSVIHFQREKNASKRSVDEENVANMEKVEFVSVKDNTDFNILKMDRAYNSSPNFSCIKYDNFTSNYSISWEITLGENRRSKLYLNGELKDFRNSNITFNGKALKQIPDVDLDALVIELIKANRPEYTWNGKLGAAEVPDLNELDVNEIVSFSKNIGLTNTSTPFGIFNHSTVTEVPIMPGNNSVAKEWFEIYVENKICNGYVNTKEFNEALDNLKESMEFREYGMYIDLMDNKYFVNKFRNNKKMDKYWGLQAPLDLQPDIKNNQGLIVKNIASGSRYSMAEIVSEIIGDKEPEKFVFASKFVKNKHQIKKFELFAEAFKLLGVKDIRLISPEYPSLKDKSIAIETYDQIYGDKKFWRHDRYFAFKASGGWYYYKMTAELDQCMYDNNLNINDWTVDTVGAWRDISIIRLEREYFPEELTLYIDRL